MSRKRKANFLSIVDGCVLNESDWSALQDVFLDWGRCHQEYRGILNEIIEIHENDKDRTVRKFGCPSWIESLHPSIGRLQALQELELCFTLKLTSLPQEIGNLGSLTKLHITCSNITSLPPSIGQLQNLQVLDLRSTYWLRTLPKEIGNLGNLLELNLTCSGITNLPNEIGKLGRLIKLALRASRLTRLPTTIQTLDALQYISLCSCNIGELEGRKDIRNKFISSLLKRCKSLGEIDPEFTAGNEYALACNRCRSRTIMNPTGKPSIDSRGWPIILEHETHAFRPYHHDTICNFSTPTWSQRTQCTIFCQTTNTHLRRC